MEELDQELRNLKSGRCKDSAGIFAEMLKHGGPRLAEVLLDMFNAIIGNPMTTPQNWKEAIITVLYKSGDPKLPKNYRPITIIPILYKLFSRLLYQRLSPILDVGQCKDQAGFRRGYST
eukprot:11504529-Karenia_brevis.AAC.1